MEVATIVMALVTAGMCIAILLLSIEIWLAKHDVPPSGPATVSRPKVAVLIPAHNEEHEIAATLRHVRPQLMEGDCCVVVADNCGDRTAGVARGYGVEVVERFNAEKRGKGYALDAGLQYLAAAPPDVVVVVDADSQLEPGALERIARHAHEQQSPVQAGDELFPPADASIRDRLSSFAFRLKNRIRPSGLQRLGGDGLLYGTGMALPWKIASSINLANGDSVEDMQLTVELAKRGHSVKFLNTPCVTGYLPSSGSEAQSQRKRWEHGHVRVLLTQAPTLAWKGLCRMNGGLLLLALDIAIPPLALLVILSGLVLSTQAMWGLITGNWTFFLALATCLLIGGLSLVRAWWTFARDLLGVRDLVRIPAYVMWKLPIYLGLFGHMQRRWQGT